MPKKPALLAGCPQLEDVRICLPSCEDGMSSLVISSRKLQKLWLKQIHHGGPVLLDFTSSAHSLQEINVQDHRVVQSIEFTHQFFKLERLQLQSCSRLIKITGLECLPNLRSLIVSKCAELQALGSLGAVRMLELLNLVDCPLLILSSQGLGNLEVLEKISVSNCPNVQIFHGDLENLTALKFIECTVSGNMLKLEKLEKLENLALGRKIGEEQAATQLSLCYSMNGEANCEQMNDNAQLQSSIKCVPLLVVRESAPAHLSSLRLDSVGDLVCLDGIDGLVTLRDLWLAHLPKLASLQGLQSLTHLRLLHIEHCMDITELPSLCTLVKMESLYIGQCANLTALEGCDKLRSLNYADFHGCENLELCPFPAEQLSQPDFLQNGELSFTDCKFASMKVLVGWLLGEEVSSAVWDASLYALEWELHDRFPEQPHERMQVGEQLVEAVAAHLTRTLPTLTLDFCFDFEPWVDDLKAAWRYAWKVRARPSYPRGLERVLRSLGGVPCRRLLEQCTSDAPFRTSVASCLLDTHPRVLHDWIERIREDVE